MPLDTRATQTTATNSATYLANSRRRVLGTGASAEACCGASAPLAPGRVEARNCFSKSIILIRAQERSLSSASPAIYPYSITSSARASSIGEISRSSAFAVLRLNAK